MEYDSEEALIKYFESEIQKESAQQIAQLHREIEAAKKKALAKLELEVDNHVALTVGAKLKDVRDQYRQDVNRSIEEGATKLFERRSAIANDLFAAVGAKLTKFVAGPGYETYVKTKLAGALAAFPEAGPIVFYVGANDAVCRAAILETGLKEIEIVADPTIAIGGFRLVSPHADLEINETLDDRLRESKNWFYANSKLFIKS